MGTGGVVVTVSTYTLPNGFTSNTCVLLEFHMNSVVFCYGILVVKELKQCLLSTKLIG